MPVLSVYRERAGQGLRELDGLELLGLVPPHQEYRRLLQLRAEGHTYKEVEIELGLSHERVKNLEWLVTRWLEDRRRPRATAHAVRMTLCAAELCDLGVSRYGRQAG